MPSTPNDYPQFPTEADLFYLCTTSSTSQEDLDLPYTPPSKSSLKIGVLILGYEQHQLLDLAAIDLLTMVSRNCISKMSASRTLLDASVDEVDIRYISESGEGSFSVTSGARMPVTNSFEDAPPLDVLLIPGTLSAAELPHSAAMFIRGRILSMNTIAVFSIASGILPLIQAGVLHGKKATGPRFLLPALQRRFPGTSWQETQWARHENIWTSSSPVAAIDMLATWIRQYFWDRREVVECALRAAGVSYS